MYSAIGVVVVVVVMRHSGVNRLKARGRGMGRWRHRYAKYADSLSKGATFFNFFTVRPGFKKVRLRDPFGRSAKMMQNMCISMWMAP